MDTDKKLKLIIKKLKNIHNIPDDIIRFQNNFSLLSFHEDERELLQVLFEKFNLIQFFYKMISKSEFEFRLIAEKANDGIITVDEDYSIIFCNQAVEKMFGYEKNEIINNSMLKLFVFEEHISLIENLSSLLTGRSKDYILEATAIKSNYVKFPIEVSFSLNNYNNYITYTIIFRDITTRKNLENQLKQHTENLEELVDIRTNELIEQNIALDEANKQLKKVDELKSIFLSNVSHEIRTPLTSIKSSAKIIKKYAIKRPDSIERFSDIIIEEVDRLTRLINNVLDLSKIEAGEVVFDFKEQNIYKLIYHIYSVVSPAIYGKNLEFFIDIDAEIPMIILDKDTIIQVLVNLINNAVKFTPKGKITLRVVINQNKTKLKFFLIDTGVGIHKEDLENVFYKFKQSGDTLTDKPTGTGLGLSISKEIIQRHGGAIWAESELGKGSKFIFVLPIKNNL